MRAELIDVTVGQFRALAQGAKKLVRQRTTTAYNLRQIQTDFSASIATSPLERILDHYLDLYHSRRRLDAKRQPSWQTALSSLDSWLQTLPPHHPYNIARGTSWPRDFSSVCRGNLVSLHGRASLFRISNVNAVIRPDNSEAPFSFNEPDQNWATIEADQRKYPSPWLPLDCYVRGCLPGKRNFTWWTPEDIASGDLMENAHRLGLPNDWLDRPLLLLKIVQASDVLDRVRIPTAIDGFDSPIFYAPEESIAQIGTAIDIRVPTSLAFGAPESVADDVPVHLIHVQAIYIDPALRRKSPVFLSVLLPFLIDFYDDVFAKPL